jgi:hypothetical protein
LVVKKIDELINKVDANEKENTIPTKCSLGHQVLCGSFKRLKQSLNKKSYTSKEFNGVDTDS